jgi:hypothetical protein
VTEWKERKLQIKSEKGGVRQKGRCCMYGRDMTVTEGDREDETCKRETKDSWKVAVIKGKKDNSV